VEGVLWDRGVRALPGVICREAFGDWNSVYSVASVVGASRVFWWRIFEAMSDDPDFGII